MDLQNEPVIVRDWLARSQTLRRHGANRAEIEFLQDRRVELNAMTSRQFVDFIEQKFAEHGVTKLIPDHAVLEQHWRHLLAQRLAAKEFDKIRARVEKRAAKAALPEDLAQRVADKLEENPAFPWDYALSQIE
jgi:hypothetical protein